MSFKILPAEVFVTEYGALIRTRCPKEHITNAMIHQRVLASNLACGDTVRVQCMNHERNTVLYFAEWLVFDRKAEIQRAEINDRETRTVEVLKFSVFRTVDWTATPAAGRKVKGKAVWNVGRTGYVIEVEGQEVGFVEDKETAHRVAAGELPLPEAKAA